MNFKSAMLRRKKLIIILGGLTSIIAVSVGLVIFMRNNTISQQEIILSSTPSLPTNLISPPDFTLPLAPHKPLRRDIGNKN